MKYFAYGSNMLTARLTARVPSAKFVGLAKVHGRKLTFHKKSNDLSGKCNIPRSDDNNSLVYGVLFEIADAEWDDLDQHEGAGLQYSRKRIEVVMDSETVSAEAYFATPNYIDDDLIPYDWYHRLVVAGAQEHKLPEDYLKSIEAVSYQDDPNPARKTRREALNALEAAESKF